MPKKPPSWSGRPDMDDSERPKPPSRAMRLRMAAAAGRTGVGDKYQPITQEMTITQLLSGSPVYAHTLPEPMAEIVREVMSPEWHEYARIDVFRAVAPRYGVNPEPWIKRALELAPSILTADTEPLSLLTAGDLLSTTFGEPVWAVPNLLPVGLAILAGAPKLGKSWLGLQVAQGIAAGSSVLGEPVPAGPVLYLALEDPPRRLQERMRKQGWQPGLDAEFMPLDRFADEIGDLVTRGKILQEHIERRGYRLVVIDTLSRALGGAQNDINTITRVLTPLQVTAQRANCAVLLIDHHRKKNGDTPDAVADILGTTGKGAMTDTAWGLYRERGRSGARLVITGREVQGKTLALTMDWEHGCWILEGDAAALEMTERRQEILDALKSLGQARVRDIAGLLGQDRTNTYKRLQDLVNARRVLVENGVYSLP